jgi:hypothetical protein
MPCKDLGKFGVYILPPLNIIPIGRICEPGVKSELQMIVRIDEPRHDKEATQVNLAVSGVKGRGKI